MTNVYGERIGQALADEEWLRDAGEREWVVLMKDAKIRYRPAELQVVVDHDLRAFCLTNANLRGVEMAQRFVEKLPRIVRIVRIVQLKQGRTSTACIRTRCARSGRNERDAEHRRLTQRDLPHTDGMATFDDFIAELDADARADGPDAVDELETFRLRFSLARELTTQRRALHPTQKQLAEQTGIDQAEIGRIERGKANPTTATLGALTRALGVDVRLVPTS